ncbi:G-protein coupled receptor 52 [Holothuria leucospilota]|uniref:G-protein coupled receptor 52 n=1 Tax=Holothuria leucospilota TaxID=206669 RepID=A0A9Q1C4U9_HOLLE|nr:G-protein coupled receptor 52 [Holothuria leucospilota]
MGDSFTNTGMNDTDFTRSSVTVVTETLVITIISIMILVCNIGNIIILRTIRFWHKSTVYLLLNLALSDICVAIFTITAIPSAASYSHENVSDLMCKVQAFLGGTSGTVSLVTLAYISVDRYIIIVHPLRHQSLMSKRTITAMIALSWILPSVLYVWVFWDDLLANVTIFYCYGHILMIARKHSKKIFLQRTTVNVNGITAKRSYKAAGTFIAVFGMFNLCWVPYVTLVIYRALQPLSSEGDKNKVPHAVNFILPWMAMSNSFVNIFIYFGLNAQYRRAVKGLLYCQRWVYNVNDGTVYTETQF